VFYVVIRRLSMRKNRADAAPVLAPAK
jgi:hypothetical protein